MTKAAASILLILLSACTSSSNKQKPQAAIGSPSDAKPQPTIKVYVSADVSTRDIRSDEAFTAKTGIKVEQEIAPGNDMFKKIDLDLASAGTVDVIPLPNPLPYEKYVNEGYLLPLNDLMKADHNDAERIYGKYLTKQGDIIYSLPASVSVWAVFYNKKIFDDAGVPYPPSEWTWDQYIETAKKLTDPAKGIYGSYMLDFDIYLFILAKQHNVSAYKADGSSNYDDPILKKA
jgi:multiple sugar transport system substrate-binding protein